MKKNIDSSLKNFEKKIRTSFKTIKEEFEDHLDAINENTKEVQENFDFLNKIDEKIEKLSSRIDSVELMLRKILEEQEFKQIKLSQEEETVFKTLYTFGEQSSLSTNDIARKANLPELSVMLALKSVINKGIPILEEIIDGHSFYTLDIKFKQLQAKRNVLGINIEHY